MHFYEFIFFNEYFYVFHSINILLVVIQLHQLKTKPKMLKMLKRGGKTHELKYMEEDSNFLKLLDN